MATALDQHRRALVRRRASERCEYCGISQASEPFLRFHVEHIIPRQHGGDDGEENLALACPHCNLHKGTNLTSIDPDTGSVVRLFHPRLESWSENFRWTGGFIEGTTASGRTTVKLLKMNGADRVELRLNLVA